MGEKTTKETQLDDADRAGDADDARAESRGAVCFLYGPFRLYILFLVIAGCVIVAFVYPRIIGCYRDIYESMNIPLAVPTRSILAIPDFTYVGFGAFLFALMIILEFRFREKRKLCMAIYVSFIFGVFALTIFLAGSLHIGFVRLINPI